MPEPTNLDAITTWCHTCGRPVSMPHEHGDAPPTPTVNASDIALAEKWFRPSHGDLVPRKAAIASMAAEIAAAREAWGVPREAVAGLVEAVEKYVARDEYAPGSRQRTDAWFALYAALENVKGAAT